jgi:cell division protein FtsQ
VVWSSVGAFSLMLIGAAYYSGVPQALGLKMARAVGDAGFEVKNIEVTGIDRMERLAVYEVLLDQHSMAMPLVNLEAKRQELLGFSWVEDARVSRRLPDTLVVDIVERKPMAVWQRNQQLSLIDGKGKVLEAVSPNAMPDLPILVGFDANQHAGAFAALQGRVPSMKSKIVAASWIGGRRWDVQFKSGETLALPEGKDAAEAALMKFTQIDGTKRLLGRGYSRIDMRNPLNMVIRVPRDLNKAHSGGEDATHKGGSSDAGENG